VSHVLVTGASGGIGAAICQVLAARGASVTLHFRVDRSAAESTRRALAGDGHRLIQAELGDPAAVAALWQEANTLQRVDVVINNAGIFPNHPPLTTDYADWTAAWQHTLATNLSGPANLSFLAARAMAEHGGGRIVNVSSRGAFRGEPTAPAYAASKAGLNALSQSLAKGLAPKGILVYCIAPGWVETEMAAEILAGPRGSEIRSQHLLGRITRSEEVARTVVFCALDAPAAMTGSIIDVNGASYLRT
jgi:NAD(P)-dependent dehydrogenase (short-subunit alcohol dehydrogenase family)